MEKLKRNSYVMYFNVSDAALDLLSDKEYKEFGMMIHEYVFFGIEPETDNMTIKMLLKLYRPALDDSLASYDKRATGNGGGRKKKHKEPQETIENHSKPQETIDDNMDTTANPNNNVNVNVNDNEIVPECNNTRKQKEYDGTMTVDTSTSTNNQAHNVEKEKEQYDVNVDTSNYEPTESEINEMFGSLKEKQDKEIEVTDTNSNKINSSFEISPSYPNWKDDTELVPVFGDNFKSSELEKLLEGFSDKNDKTLHPTRKQLLCMTYLEKLSFCRRDFKNIYEKPGGIDGFESNSWTELIGCVLFKLKPIADKYNFKRTGIPDCEVYQDMFKSFFNKNYNHFKICVPEIK